jgi:hypothetical protein
LKFDLFTLCGCANWSYSLPARAGIYTSQLGCFTGLSAKYPFEPSRSVRKLKLRSEIERDSCGIIEATLAESQLNDEWPDSPLQSGLKSPWDQEPDHRRVNPRMSVAAGYKSGLTSYRRISPGLEFHHISKSTDPRVTDP